MVHLGLLPTDGMAGAGAMLGGMLLGQQQQRPAAQGPPRLTATTAARQQRIPTQAWANSPAIGGIATLAAQQNVQHPQYHLPAYWAIQPHARHGVHAPQAESHRGLPPALYRLLDPTAAVELPPCDTGRQAHALDNRELDKLVAGLGRSKATWRRALMLHQWLQGCGHTPDARLATTLIRVCSQHGQALAALGLYDWMRATRAGGAASLTPTVFTYTAAMRAALAGNLLTRAFQVWDDAVADGCEADCRMATTLIEVCSRAGNTQRAIRTYDAMRAAPPGSRMAPSVHAYTAAMRAAAEGGFWQRALDMWDDMTQASCRPTGHAFAAVISACATGGEWRRGAALFDEMRNRWGIKPDVVSCTALVTAFGTDGQWARAQQVVDWMHGAGIRPNVRTYTALVAALGRGGQWDRARRLLGDMRRGCPWGGAEPNAYTYSALLKCMGDQGRWELAEGVFAELEAEVLGRTPADAAQQGASPAPAHLPFALAASQTAGSEIPSNGGSMWSSELPSLPVGLRTLPDELSSGSDTSTSADCSTPLGGAFRRTSSSGSFNPLEAYGLLPTSLAEEVLDSGADRGALADALPDDLPGQSNCGAADSADASFVSQQCQQLGLGLDAHSSPAVWQLQQQSQHPQDQQQQRSGGKAPRSALNEVVCGAVMLAFERAGQIDKCVGMLTRAQRLGITTNTVMLNTALSALAKAGRTAEAAALFGSMPTPDAVSFETLAAAHGLAGDAAAAEAAVAAMQSAGLQPTSYAYCSLISAHSLAGDVRSALGVASRMAAAGVAPSVHSYNALIAATERASAWDAGLKLRDAMAADGIAPNQTTLQLMTGLARGGVSYVEVQQVAVTALSAAVAAAGSVFMSTGAF